jgi:hypothetical protein
MSIWWHPWAERIARTLAEAWVRSCRTGATGSAAPTDRAAGRNPDPRGSAPAAAAAAPAAAAPAADPAPPGVLP